MKGALEGVRVVVTRAVEDAGELEDLLRERGAVPLRFPCIAFEDGPDVEEIARRLAARVDLVVVSSPQAARRVAGLIGRTSGTSRTSRTFGTPKPLFAAVGPGTAALLPGRVIVPDQGAGADALLAVLAPRVAGKRILVPRAERATQGLTEGLRRAGAIVEELTLYRTVTPARADLGVLAGAEAVSFASGSAVRGFVQLAGAEAANQRAVAAIGASTAAEAKALGVRVDAWGGEGLIGLCEAVALAVRAGKG